MQTTVILSNRLDPLIDTIGERLFAEIARRKVVVPDRKLKNYFLLRLAECTERQVAMGMETVTLHELMAEHFPSESELSIRLQYKIAMVKDEGEFTPLFSYLKKSGTPPSSFCDLLAHTFLQYALYGGEDLQKWLNQEGFQQTLWKEFNFVFPPQEGIEWHLLGFNFLPRQVVDYFKNQGATFYLFSPCQEFWEDLCSDKERAHLGKRLSINAQEALEGYLQDQNSLLANMGKMGRVFLREFQDMEIQERYVPEEGKTLLERVKRSILELSSFEKGEEDDSIQLYAAASLLQEVELLYTVLHGLMQREEIQPKDIQVFASDINLYAPLIHLVFGREGSKIHYALSDLDLSLENHFVRGFLQLLRLPEHRFEPISILHLFENPLFSKKFSLSENDLEKIREWAEKISVRWGMDASGRDLLLKEKMLEETEDGTWKGGFIKLLQGLAMLGSGIPFVVFSEAELLGKFLDVMHSLSADLCPLFDGTRMSIEGWRQLLNKLGRTYFVLEEDGLQQLKKMDGLFLRLKDLQEPIFDFSPVYKIVENLFTVSSGSYKTNNLQSIHFSSFPKGSAVPKKVTWILGMQEGAFPRMERANSLSEAVSKPLSKCEEDRYLFLEILFAAKSHLIFSYINLSPKDHKLQTPSLPVQELFSFVQKSLTTSKKFPQLHLLKKEGPLPFLHSFYHSEKIENRNSAREFAVEIKTLEKCAKYPLKFYFHEKLGIYLERSKEKDEEFVIPAFIKSKMRNAALKRPFEEILQETAFQRHLPLGRFKEIVPLKLMEEMDNAGAFSYGEIVSRDFSRAPLHFSLKAGGSASIRGVLENVTEEGFLYYGDKKISELLKIWPTYLIFLMTSPNEAKKDLLLLKAGKRVSPPSENPETLLRDYLEYYQLCLQFPSPFLPDFAEAFLTGTAEELEKAIKKRDHALFKDEYLEWIIMRDSFPSSEHLIANWAGLLRTLFAPFLEWRSHAV